MFQTGMKLVSLAGGLSVTFNVSSSYNLGWFDLNIKYQSTRFVEFLDMLFGVFAFYILN